MDTIHNILTADHRACDALFAAVEEAVAQSAWERADAAFTRFDAAMRVHFEVEEDTLFPAFEARTGMTMGPTQVMRSEHNQMRDLLAAARQALAGRDAEDYSGYAETLLIMAQQHNMKEENILYPMCDQHLAGSAAELAAQLKGRITVQ